MAENSTQSTPVLHRRFEGEVISKSGDKTISVRVNTTKMHAKYNKQYVTSKKYAVHDEKNAATVGDRVVVEECRPYSKQKRWRLVQVVS